jgi:hypothetical protein
MLTKIRAYSKVKTEGQDRLLEHSLSETGRNQLLLVVLNLSTALIT